MSLEEVKTQVAGMTEQQQEELMAYVVHLRHHRDETVRREITGRIDDRNPANWISLAALKEEWKG